jgi:hypothetical protein
MKNVAPVILLHSTDGQRLFFKLGRDKVFAAKKGRVRVTIAGVRYAIVETRKEIEAAMRELRD